MILYKDEKMTPNSCLFVLFVFNHKPARDEHESHESSRIATTTNIRVDSYYSCSI